LIYIVFIIRDKLMKYTKKKSKILKGVLITRFT